MLPASLLLLCLTAIGARAQDSSTSASASASASSSSSSSSTSTSTHTNAETTLNIGTDSRSFITVTTDLPTSAFTGSEYTYLSIDGQTTLNTTTTTATGNSSASSTASSTDSQITRTTESQSLIQIGGVTSTSNATSSTSAGSSTSSAARPVNTVPCNNYPEFCTRRYSNITEVCAHNSAFDVKNNAASNQALTITQQLNDGVRMIQGETHLANGTIYNCHTSCDLLNAGTWQSELETIVAWLQLHPYDVLTILIVNSDFADGVTVADYVAPIQNSGIAPYLYEPQYIPQYRDQWPTLGEMILTNKRVVMFMDYNANQTAVPYVLDEFTHMWETPFSPTNQSFPCTQQRPPDLNQTVARDQFMYLANHNLNLGINIGQILGSGDETILLPNTALLNVTNGAANQFGRLGAASENCTAEWGRPPNFLLVDYYNIGSPEAGSVFEVAAQANNVTYNRACCGTNSSGAPIVRSSLVALLVALAFAMFLAR